MSLISGNVVFNSGSVNCSANINIIFGNSNFCSNARNCGLISSGTFFDVSDNLGTGLLASFTGNSSNKGIVSTASFLGSAVNSGTVATGSFSETSSNLGTAEVASFTGTSINRGVVPTACFLGSAVNSGNVSTGTFFGSSINLTTVCNACFTGTSINRGSINEVTFVGSSINGGVVRNATFSESASNTGSITGLGSFLDSAVNSGTVQNATFSGFASNVGVISSSGLFYGSSSNSGIVSGNVIFSGCSSNLGTVCGDATFLGSAYNYGGCILGIATANNGDPYFLNNVMLLNGDGSNNQTNACFLNSSTGTSTITGSGNATQGSFSPYNPEGWSSYFNGSSYLTLPASFSTNLSGIGVGATTFETWVYPTSFTGSCGCSSVLIGNYLAAVANGRWNLSLVSNASLNAANVNFGWTTSTSLCTGVFTTSLGVLKDTWSHIAVVVDPTTPSNSTIDIFINGNKSTFTNNNLSSQTCVHGQVKIGGCVYASSNFVGYISNFKITKNQKVYTDSFVPPTLALKTTSENTIASRVQLLTLQNNRFVDNSINSYALTNTGGVITQPLDPFIPTSVYNPRYHGGSAYLNGASAISFASNSSMAFGTGNFTIDFWIYPTTAGTGGIIFKMGASFNGTVYDVAVAYNASGVLSLNFWPSGASPILRINSSTNAAPVNVWTHVAVVRSGTGANQTKLYVNGVENGTTTLGTAGTLNYNFTGTGTGFIGRSDANNAFYTGYVSNVRVVKGTAIYTSAFTPPASPTTAVSGTLLLLNFNNGGLIDRSNKAILTTNGDVKISTSQIKFGSGSMYFDGTGDYLTAPTAGDLFKFGTGKFTIEFWIYPLAYGGTVAGAQIFGTVNGSTSGYSINLGQDINSFRIISNATGTWTDNLTVSTGNGPELNTWTHMAIVRNGTNLTIYKNGTSVATTSSASTWSFDGTVAIIGRLNDGTNIKDFNGYLDDLRITKGIARYTGNFTPPDAALNLT